MIIKNVKHYLFQKNYTKTLCLIADKTKNYLKEQQNKRTYQKTNNEQIDVKSKDHKQIFFPKEQFLTCES